MAAKNWFKLISELGDDEFQTVCEIVNERRSARANGVRYLLEIGTKVRFHGKSRGIHAGMQEGVVVSKGPKKAKVRVKANAEWMRDVTWTVPYNMLEIVGG